MKATKEDLVAQLVARADRDHNGHFAILKFTTNWRVALGTPDFSDFDAVLNLPVGSTLEEAASNALRGIHPPRRTLADIVVSLDSFRAWQAARKR